MSKRDKQFKEALTEATRCECGKCDWCRYKKASSEISVVSDEEQKDIEERYGKPSWEKEFEELTIHTPAEEGEVVQMALWKTLTHEQLECIKPFIHKVEQQAIEQATEEGIGIGKRNTIAQVRELIKSKRDEWHKEGTFKYDEIYNDILKEL